MNWTQTTGPQGEQYYSYQVAEFPGGQWLSSLFHRAYPEQLKALTAKYGQPIVTPWELLVAADGRVLRDGPSNQPPTLQEQLAYCHRELALMQRHINELEQSNAVPQLQPHDAAH